MKLIIKPPSCFNCGEQFEWKDINCPTCGFLTPHLGKDWNKPKK